jgi:hypothetical protein
VEYVRDIQTQNKVHCKTDVHSEGREDIKILDPVHCLQRHSD